MILVLAVSYFFGTQILITFNCEWKVFICSFIGMITNLTLNLVLIPKMYQDGAVIASVVSETISAINEVQQMKQNPSLGKAYTDVDKMMEELLA